MDCLTFSFIIPIHKMFNAAVKQEVLVPGSRVNKIQPLNRISNCQQCKWNREVQRNPAWYYQKDSSWKGQCKSKCIIFSFLVRSDDCSWVKKKNDVTYFPKTQMLIKDTQGLSQKLCCQWMKIRLESTYTFLLYFKTLGKYRHTRL